MPIEVERQIICTRSDLFETQKAQLCRHSRTYVRGTLCSCLLRWQMSSIYALHEYKVLLNARQAGKDTS